ncbi:acyl CoA:acetate/3-ketoacid CoA transferase [Neoroseomonas oryzicola]|uniref:Acetate CoA-transferase YdiF n=1 Tax=Neoroseomonas oryzicola TaxID=535904 RepID=A0A9X9WC87_9PROT|nr:CoA-transferase [Neoroseomonas oryzicola]MBR0657947.1 3-oxoacid CoA-transferase [Neoroseomonas oryzicola]NKE18735.1 3-oxoacid CoA-transferase [Neoroseomonas oryzicola]
MRQITAAQAAAALRDGDTLLIGGSGGGHAVPDALLEAVGNRFRETGAPRGITALHPVGLGDGKTRGAGHLAQDGLLKRVVSGTFVNSPGIARLALDEKIEAYTLPQGALSQLMREMAAGRAGLLTKVGLRTFVDPRIGGGRQSQRATEDLIEVVTLRGEEYLFYKPYKVDVAFIRGSAIDEAGNLSMEHEAVTLEMLSIAQATRRQGGIVIAQAKRLVPRGKLHPKMVKVPGILVDAFVIVPDQWQTYETQDSLAYSGHHRVALDEVPRLPPGPRRIVARRGAMELFEGAVCNLGSGISTGIANVAAEEAVLDRICLTNEQGNIGGAPASGNEAGAASSPDAQVDQPYQFDFYDGGGLDLAFLSFAEFDAAGNVNVSRFGGRIVGPGGFVNISQGAGRVVFGGTLTAGEAKKAVQQVEQISFSGPYARERGQEVLYVTERAVFRLGASGPELIEVAPGLDVERDVIDAMAFRPAVSPALKQMDAALFADGPMGLAARLPPRPVRTTAGRLP